MTVVSEEAEKIGVKGKHLENLSVAVGTMGKPLSESLGGGVDAKGKFGCKNVTTRKSKCTYASVSRGSKDKEIRD
jgi:hypothetical protein